MMKLSVIIPTYHRESVVSLALKALNESSSVEDFEVIVVLDGGSEGSRRQIERLVGPVGYPLRFLIQEKRGPAAARNLGMRAAAGAIILNINDDTLASPELIGRHLRFHEENPEENFGLLGFLTWSPNLPITPLMYWLEHGGPYFSFGAIKGREVGWERFWTCNISLKKGFVLEHGGFDEEFPYAAWEDVELGFRLSKADLRLFYDEKAVGYHYHPTTLRSIKNKMRVNGESLALLREKMPVVFLPPLAKRPRLSVWLGMILLNPPVFFALEKLAFLAETRFNIGPLFDLILLRYRLEGLAWGLRIYGVLRNYSTLLAEEMGEWEKTESQMLKKGVAWWMDLRRASISGKNIFWRSDPKKEAIVRGEEKRRMIEMAVHRGGRVLDLGCGSGWLSLELARNGLTVTGVDASPTRIGLARRFLAENLFWENFGRVDYILGDLHKVGFPAESFTTIVVWDTLHHFPDLDTLLSRYKTFLKEGGQMIVFDHVGHPLLKLAERIYRFFPTNRREKIIAYEDVLGWEMIEVIKRHFRIVFCETKLCIPTSLLLYTFFRYDLLQPFLPWLIRLDKKLCRFKLLRGEYIFLKVLK